MFFWQNGHTQNIIFCVVSMLKHKLSIVAITTGICSLIVIDGMTDIAKTLNQNPDLAFAYTVQGNVRAEIFDDRQGAIESFTRSIQLKPERAVTYYFRAKTRYKSGDNRGAIEDFNRSLRLKPDYVNAYISRGVVRSNSGHAREAIADYDRAIAIQPDDANAYYNRGVARLDLSNKQGAIEDLDRAAKLFQRQGKTRESQDVIDLTKKCCLK
jgi:tetratricopeptide (TPR) repeat protein